MQGDPLMMNYIAIIRVNHDKFPKVNASGALAFADWLEGKLDTNVISEIRKGSRADAKVMQ